MAERKQRLKGQGGFVGTDAEPKVDGETVAEWTYLPGGWLRLVIPGWDGWTVEVLAGEQDGQVLCQGLRVLPPDGEALTGSQLRKLSPYVLARVAQKAQVLDVQGLRESIADLEGQRRPYGGSEDHRQAVRAVVSEAAARGETPWRAVKRVFGVSKPTAYRWINDAEQHDRTTKKKGTR